MTTHQEGKGGKSKDDGNQEGRGFAKNPQLASEAGKKGGSESGGNFKNDPERASEAGKKGGHNSHGGGRS